MKEVQNLYEKSLIKTLKNPFSPKSLYKYLDIEGGKISLKKNTLKFAKPTSFEDISECRSLRLNHQIKEISKKKDLYAKSQIEDFKDIVLISKIISQETIDLSKTIDERLINKFGICCLSEKAHNEYLWNYQAIKHNGICIEYEAVGLRKFLRQKLKTEDGFHLCSRAIYSDNINSVDFDLNDKLIVTILNWFFVKKKNPFYEEHEVRIVSNFDHGNKYFSLITLPKEIVKRIYVGRNVSEFDFAIIQKIVNKEYSGSVDIIRSI